jgi:hypothetical protein
MPADSYPTNSFQHGLFKKLLGKSNTIKKNYSVLELKKVFGLCSVLFVMDPNHIEEQGQHHHGPKARTLSRA